MFRTFAMPATLALSLLAAAGTAQQAGADSASDQAPADDTSASAPAVPAPGSLGSGGTVGAGNRVTGFTFGGALPMSPANAFVSYFDARYVNDGETEVHADDIAASAVNSGHVADGSLTGADIADDSLTASDLAAGSVGSSEIADGSITANDLGTQAVTNAKIAFSAVTTLSIADNTISSADIGSSAVGSSELAFNAVSGSHIQTGAVGSSDVLDNSLTASDLASNSVGADEITANAVGASELTDALQNWSLNSTPYSNVDYRMFCAEQDSFSHGVMVETSVEYVGDFVFSTYESNGDHNFRVDSSGNVFADGTVSGGGAFASLIETTEGEREHLRGDVLAIDPSNPRAVRLARGARSTLVAGVYGEQVGMLSTHREFDRVVESEVNGAALQGGGGPLSGAQALTMRDMYDFYSEIPAVTSGIVEVRVSAENGAILPGDLLVTAWTPGHAMRDADPKVGTVLGKALGELQSGTGLIEVLITLD